MSLCLDFFTLFNFGWGGLVTFSFSFALAGIFNSNVQKINIFYNNICSQIIDLHPSTGACTQCQGRTGARHRPGPRAAGGSGPEVP